MLVLEQQWPSANLFLYLAAAIGVKLHVSDDPTEKGQTTHRDRPSLHPQGVGLLRLLPPQDKVKDSRA